MLHLKVLRVKVTIEIGEGQYQDMRRIGSPRARITELACELGIDGIGFCEAGPLTNARQALETATERGLIPREIAPRPSTVTRLTTPGRHLKGARSVISTYASYYTGEAAPTDPAKGTIAYYTRCNYYDDLRRRLTSLADIMQGEFGCRTKTFSCYVTLAEKPLASRSGLGFYGKHGVIITPRHGSYVVLGEILTDLEIEADEELDLDCGSCNLCVEACPTGALAYPYFVERRRCIQYLSERSLVVPVDIRDVWRNRLYGCTTCQDVCPYNRDLSPIGREVTVGRIGSSVPLADMLCMSEDEFRVRFSDNQVGYRDLNAIRKNAIVAAGNSRSDAFVPLLEACAGDPDPVIRQHSLWALVRIRGGGARPVLDRALGSEDDDDVRSEIKTLLDALGGFE
jgi:epoxyqueuosine reductase